jgi:aminoglycoside phosphotransferase
VSHARIAEPESALASTQSERSTSTVERIPSDPAAERASAILVNDLGRDEELRPLEHGESNDVWAAGQIVLRVATAPGSSDLLVEADTVSQLDSGVGYPTVLGQGRHDDHEWMALERLPGDNLAVMWPTMSPNARRRAISDLWIRLTSAHRTDTRSLQHLRTTPFYRLDHDAAVQDLLDLEVVDERTSRSLQRLLRDGFDAMADQPMVLTHTDAGPGPGNTVWDGKHAIPIDFEFATLGPSDLDIENLGQSLSQLSPNGLDLLKPLIRDQLTKPGGLSRLRAYAVLRDTWAVAKWVANAPERRNIEHWGPVRNLHAHANRSSWPSHLTP